MQNKPNFLDAQINVNPYNTTYYENKSNWTLGENKPNSKPIKPNSKPIKAKTNPIQTQNKPNQSQFQTGHLLVNRMKPKLLNFHLKNSLTGLCNSVKYHFLYSEREYFYEELYGKERAGRA